MMALDHSPESFSQQYEFYRLYSYVPTCDPTPPPRWHQMNEIYRGPHEDATYQKSKFYPF